MKAAVLHEPKTPLVIEDIGLRKPKAHEVLIKTAFSGLCHSDLHFMEGHLPFPLPAVFGHEASGVVEQVGSEVTYVKPGDKVITCLSVFCGTCDNCTQGHQVICLDENVKTLPGKLDRLTWNKPQKLNTGMNLAAFAEQMLVHENAVVKIREDMPMDKAALIGCSIITGVGSVIRSAKVEPGQTVVIIGCGGVGMAAINGAYIAGAGRIIAVDTNPAKLQLATKLGATDIINPSDGDIVERIKDLTSDGVHHSIDCIGHKRTAEQSFEMLPMGGTATIVGLVTKGVKLELSGWEFSRQRKIQGAWMGGNHFRVDMPRLIEFYLQGRLHLDEWVSEIIDIQQINEGFDLMRQGKGVRTVIDFKI